MVLRRLIVGVPVALLVVTAVAFVSSMRLTARPKNELTFGVLGEASNLNPILSTDAASGQVAGLIFQGLMTVDEEMNPVGELAESWRLRQRTVFFFGSREGAERAREVLGGEGVGVRVEGKGEWAWEVAVELPEPGLEEPRRLVAGLPDALELTTLTVELGEAVAGGLMERLGGGVAEGLRVVRFFSEGGRHLEVVMAVGEEEARAVLEGWLRGELGGGAGFVVRAEEEERFLAEPEIEFRLREGVRWQDGVGFSAEDVRFTYEAIMDERYASPRKPDFALIGAVETPDERTVVVRYRRPYAPALNSWRMGILPAHVLRGKEPGWWAEHFNRRPVGTGPFRLAEWRVNEFIRLERNPEYWRGPGPWLDAVVFRTLPDPLTLRLAFETRQVDFWGVDPWAVRSFVEDGRFDVFTAPSSSYTYIGWNLRNGLFEDVRVRRALAHAVNVPELIRYVLYGYGVQSTGIFTPQMWFFDAGVEPLGYDPERARELLAEAGWRPGPDGVLVKEGRRFAFTLMTNNGNEVRRDIATLVQDQLRRVGIEVRVELYEWAVFITRFVNKREFDAVVLGWSLPQDDFDQFQIWHSSQRNPDQLNMVGYADEETDRLLEALRQEFNRERVKALASALQRRIYEAQPYLFLFVPEGTSVMWRNALRVCRPDGRGGWVEEPIRQTKAGWGIYLEWFYRPEFGERLPEGVWRGGGGGG